MERAPVKNEEELSSPGDESQLFTVEEFISKSDSI